MPVEGPLIATEEIEPIAVLALPGVQLVELIGIVSSAVDALPMRPVFSPLALLVIVTLPPVHVPYTGTSFVTELPLHACCALLLSSQRRTRRARPAVEPLDPLLGLFEFNNVDVAPEVRATVSATLKLLEVELF